MAQRIIEGTAISVTSELFSAFCDQEGIRMSNYQYSELTGKIIELAIRVHKNL